eukprot:7015215-Prymnesium_polylepis.1
MASAVCAHHGCMASAVCAHSSRGVRPPLHRSDGCSPPLLAARAPAAGDSHRPGRHGADQGQERQDHLAPLQQEDRAAQ